MIEACAQLAGRPRDRRGPPARPRPASATRAPTSSSTSSTPAGTASSRSRRWRSASRSSRTSSRTSSSAARRRSARRVPIVPRDEGDARRRAAPAGRVAALRREIGAASRAYVEQVHDIDRIADRLLDIYARPLSARWATELRRLGDAVGDLRPRRHPLAAARDLPAAALHALPRPDRLRQDRDVVALHGRARRSCCGSGSRARSSASTSTRRTPSAAHAASCARRSGSRWAMATVGLVARLIVSPSRSRTLLATRRRPWLVRAGFVGLWAQMNYAQLTALFRVEQRPVAFVDRERRERADHDRRDGRCSSSASTRARPARSSATSSARSSSTSCCSATAATSSGSSSTARCCAR